MLKHAVACVAAAYLASSGASASGLTASEGNATYSIVIRNQNGDMLASLPLEGRRFSVSYRNSIYGTLAEERYVVLPDGRYRLVEIAADQLAVLEEYYAVPGAPQRATQSDRRHWVVPPDPAEPVVLEALSIAATDLGERTVRVPGESPLELWRLVEDKQPYVVLDIIEENP